MSLIVWGVGLVPRTISRGCQYIIMLCTSFANIELQLHISGMMTDLPVHTSSDLEISGLISTLYHYLHKINKRPSLVTVSRYNM